MIFKRFYDDRLAQASYLLACEETREAVVVDPNLDIGQYLQAAAAERVRITDVTETHIHADFVSGALALATSARAALHLSDEGGPAWGYTDQAFARAQPITEGSEIRAGAVRLRAMHTPGHTPEHLTFLVSDLERGDEAVGALTGDFIFVGDVGRPDLLERAAGVQGSMDASAAKLFNSIQRFLTYPDHLQIWPGHGAGSACGKSLGAMPQSTLGYERLFNWALAKMEQDEFVVRVLQDQPVPPRYFARMKKLNRDPNSTGGARLPRQELCLSDLKEALRAGATVVDTRTAQRFAEGHIPGTFNVPANKSFLNWCGALIPADIDLYFILDSDGAEAAPRLSFELSKIGFDAVRGYFSPRIVGEWQAAHTSLEKIPQIDVSAFSKLRPSSEVTIVDVRGADEWKQGHLPGAIHIPLAALPDRIGELAHCGHVVLHCRGGGRSSIAASFVKARRVGNVSNLAGGFDAWAKRGLEVVTEFSPSGNTSRRS